jgi:hypothetical protein
MHIDDNKLFYNLTSLDVKVTKLDVQYFVEAINDKYLPDIIELDVDEAKISIDRSKKVFKILKRYKTQNDMMAEMLLAMAIKVASRAGFTIFFEPKFSN